MGVGGRGGYFRRMAIFSTSRRGAFAGTAAAALLLLVPASSGAALITFGSTLKAPANVKKAHQADIAFWQTAFPAGRSARSPASGQIKSVKIKGIALSNWKAGQIGGERMFHLQTLRKRSNGTWKILVTTQAFFLPPMTANPQTITTYGPTNFCVAKGDYVVFNTVGGWDRTATGPFAMGTPLQIFSRVTGATVSEYEKANGTNNGAVITAKSGPGKGHELLMRQTVGTGKNGTGLCKGGTGR